MESDAAQPAGPMPSRRAILLEWLAGRPLVPPALGLVAGIVLDAFHPIPLLASILLFALAGVVIVRRRRSDGMRHLAVAVAALAVGAPLHDASFRRWPSDHIIRYCGHAPALVRLTGTVLVPPALRTAESGPAKWFAQLPRTRFLVEAERIEGLKGDIPVCGIVAVLVREPVLDAAAGDRVELFGMMHRPAPAVNPGGMDWVRYRRRTGVLVEMSCEHAANVAVRSAGEGHRPWLANVRRRAKAALLDHTFPGDVPGAQMLAALVLGQRSSLGSELNDAFVQSGTVHYLAISGSHVGMLASAVWLLGVLVGGSRRSCAAWAIMVVTAYTILVEPQPSILRATIMTDLLCVSLLLRRPVRTANWLALSLIILLPVQPTAVFDVGFQMSYLTLLAVIYLSPRVHNGTSWVIGRLRHVFGRDEPLLSPEVQARLSPSRVRAAVRRVRTVLGWYLAVTISAWAVSVPLAACYFHQFSLWGWLNTLLIMPLIWLCLVVGLGKTVLSAVSPAVAGLLGTPLAVLADALVDLVLLLARLPGSGWAAPAVPGWLAAACLAVFGLWVLSPWLRMAPRWVGLVGLGVVTLAAARLAPPGPGDTLRVDVLSVGRATTCVIQLPNGKTLLYDVGSMPPYDVDCWTLGPLLADRCVYGLAAVLLSHPNLDHYGGLGPLLTRRPVDQVLAAPHFEHLTSPQDAAGQLVREVRARGIPWRTLVRGDRLTGTGQVAVDVLWPPPVSDLPITEPNESSLVVRISYAGRRILACGDIQEFAQRRLLADPGLKADVLILPHHGSVNAVTPAFIEAVAPEYCVRSTSQRDGRTGSKLLELMAGRCYHSTANDGAIEIRITPAALTVRPFLDRRGEREPAEQGVWQAAGPPEG